ncbi:MAG TPA: hypothetical protein VIH03_06080 [Nitrososphaerales archaeon]
MSDNVELKVLENLAATIHDISVGLEPDMLAGWYKIIVDQAKGMAPEHLKGSIYVVQDDVLWMKFNIKCSRRAITYVVDAIESNISQMPFATRLYFQKVEEIITSEAGKPVRKEPAE